MAKKQSIIVSTVEAEKLVKTRPDLVIIDWDTWAESGGTVGIYRKWHVAGKLRIISG